MKRGVLLGFLLLAAGAIAPAETPSWESLLSEANRAQDLGRHAEAEALYRSALDQAQRLGVAEPRLAQLLNNLAAQCYYLGKLAESESLYKRALAGWGEERGGLRRTTSNLAAQLLELIIDFPQAEGQLLALHSVSRNADGEIRMSA